jgi:hypothetical protein
MADDARGAAINALRVDDEGQTNPGDEQQLHRGRLFTGLGERWRHRRLISEAL